MKLVPVDHDPFADAPAAPAAGPRLVPVDHDPFAPTDASAQAAAGGDAAAAVGRGIINGVPIVGPYLLGGAHRLAAGARALVNDTKFSDELANVERFSQQTASEHPIASTAGEVAGGVVGTLPMVAVAPAAFGASGGPLIARMGASALTSGAIGGADAAVRSGGDLEAIRDGALVGGVVGGAAPAVAAGAGRLAAGVASKLKPADVPSVQDLKAGARAAYQRADEAGVQVAQPSFAKAVEDLGSAAREAGIDKTIHPKATAAVGRLEEAAATAPTLKDIEILRRVVKGAGSPLNPDEARIASMLVDKLDEFTGGLKASDLISGDAQTATDALSEARALWGRAKKAETIETAITKAEDRAASTGSDGSAIRQSIRAILDSPTKLAGFTPNEVHFMREVVRGTPVQNALRLVGKLSPQGSGLMAMLGIGAAAANPTMAAIPAIGLAAKKAADHATTSHADRLVRAILNGGEAPVAPYALAAQQGGERVIHGLLGSVPLVANQRR